jgi:hypothetical protein
VSLDPGVAEELKAAAERAGAASVSEYVEGALDARMVREQWLARWRAAAGDVDLRRWPMPVASCSASGSSNIHRRRERQSPDLVCHR